jgi:type IV pilus assembly protein PilY1
MTITPNIHVGRQSGAMVFTQSSTGSIDQLEEVTPGTIKSERTPSPPVDECADEAGVAAGKAN